MAQAKKYNNLQVALHWLTAVVLLFLLVTGTLVLKEIPNADPGKVGNLRVHMLLGGLALLLTLGRIVWRATTPQPPHLATANRLLDHLGVAAHYALNFLTLLIAASGIGLAVSAGLPEVVFFGKRSVPEDFFVYQLRYVHGIGTKLLIALIALHVVGALYHKFIIKDAPFRRIWFG